MFSKACSHAIKASVFIAHTALQNKQTRLKEIAEATNSPEAFMAKILQKLVKNNIIISKRGSKGGFTISKKRIESILLKEIVIAIDGDKIYNGCILGFQTCSDAKPCAMHNYMKAARKDIKKTLTTTTLKDLANDVEGELIFLRE